jgi:hypothetical protein
LKPALPRLGHERVRAALAAKDSPDWLWKFNEARGDNRVARLDLARKAGSVSQFFTLGR